MTARTDSHFPPITPPRVVTGLLTTTLGLLTTALGLLTTALGLLVVSPAHAEDAPSVLTLRDVVTIAEVRSHEVRILEQSTLGADARVAATRAQLFPQVQVGGNVLVWDSPLEFSLAPTDVPVPDAPTLTVRDQVTLSLNVTVAQPITALYALFHVLDIEKRGQDAAMAERVRGRLDATHRAVEAFLRLLQARAVSDVAQKSLTQVEANLDRARVLESAGVLGKVDVLRLESAREGARLGLMRAEAGAVIARRGLFLTLDSPDSPRTEARDDLPDPPPKPPLSPEDASDLAVESRPELAVAARRIEQAEHGRAVALSPLLPNLIAIATYQRTEGQSTFQPKNALFAGATLEWKVWDWGKALQDADEADTKEEQAKIAKDLLRSQVAFEAERRSIEARLAFDSLATAKAGLLAAEEAQRIQAVRFAQGEATTTDVLDTETELARAQTNCATLRFEYYISLLSLLRAIGDDPQGLGASQGRSTAASPPEGDPK